MSSLFDIGKTGLNAYRQALSVTGQNIANINTDGYKRREASLEEISVGKGGVTAKASGTGAGVRVDGIRRSFDEFLLNKARSANSSAEESIAFFDQVSRLENILLSDQSNLGTAMTHFFDSLQQIVAEPADLAPRTIALEQGRVLAGEFRRVAQVTADLKDGIHDKIQNQLSTINGLSSTLAELNRQVATSGIGNQNNALLDKRDALIDEISGFVGVTVELSQNGVTTLRLGKSGDGPILVKADDTNTLKASQYADKILFSTMVGATRVLTSQVSEGSLAGLADSYSSISDTMHEIDQLAFKLVRDTNAIHSKGINLDGEPGSIIFQNIDVNISENQTNLGSSIVEYEILDHDLVQADKITFSYDQNSDQWKGRYNDGAIAAAGRTTILLPGLSLNFSGEPKDFDQFVLEPVRGQAAGVTFALLRPHDFAAASPMVSFSDPSNKSETLVEASKSLTIESSALRPIEEVFTNGLGAVTATEFLTSGFVTVVPENVTALDLVSLTKQSAAQITLAQSDLALVSSIQLEISSTDANGLVNNESYSFDLDPSNFKDDGSSWQDMNEIANLINLGSILGTDSSGTEISLAGIGGFASGSAGNLSFSLSNDEFSSANIGFTGGGSAPATIQARNDEASDVLVFTREGRQIAGATLSETAIEKWKPVIEGGLPFNDGAKFNDDYLNKIGDDAYLETEVSFADNASDILLDIDESSIAFEALYGIDTNELSPDGLSASAATVEYSINVGNLSATISGIGENNFNGQEVAKALLSELRANAPISQLVGLSNLDQEFSFTLNDIGLDEAGIHSSGRANVEYGGELYSFASDGSTITVSGGANFVRDLSYDSASETISGFARSLPDENDEFKIAFEDQEYKISVKNGELQVSGGEAGRLLAFLDEDNLLNIVSSEGSISKSELLVIDEVDASGNEDAAQRFGLISGGVSASTSFSDPSYVALDFEIVQTDNSLNVVPNSNADLPTITGSAKSLAGQRITIKDLPDEELIILVRNDGAKRIAAQYDLAPSGVQKISRDIRVNVIDETNRIVEFLDSETGTSIATRQVDDSGHTTAVSINTIFHGKLSEGDTFTIANNDNGFGDGSSLQNLISLKSGRSDAARGGFQNMFNTSVAKLGAVLQSGMVSVEAQSALREASVAAEAAYSGVSLDAEAAKLIEQQQAYQASARILATAREIFNTLVQSL